MILPVLTGSGGHSTRRRRPVLADLLLWMNPFPCFHRFVREKFSKSRLVEDGYEVIAFFPFIGNRVMAGTQPPFQSGMPGGLIIGAVETLEDITDRKIAEDALKKSEKFLNNVIENIPDMIFVKILHGISGSCSSTKPVKDLLGFSREDLYGKNDYDFFPKDEADFFTTKDRAVLNDRQVVDIPEEKRSWPLPGVSGSSIPNKNLGSR